MRLWDTTTGTHRQMLEGHSDSVNAVAFSPDGKTIASASHDRTVRLWDTTTGTHRQTLEGHSDWVHAVAFSPDGKTIASASDDRTVRLWDTTTGTHDRRSRGIAIRLTQSPSRPNGQDDSVGFRRWDSAALGHDDRHAPTDARGA